MHCYSVPSPQGRMDSPSVVFLHLELRNKIYKLTYLDKIQSSNGIWWIGSALFHETINQMFSAPLKCEGIWPCCSFPNHSPVTSLCHLVWTHPRLLFFVAVCPWSLTWRSYIGWHGGDLLRGGNRVLRLLYPFTYIGFQVSQIVAFAFGSQTDTKYISRLVLYNTSYIHIQFI